MIRIVARCRLLWHPHQRLWNWRLVARLDRLPSGSRLVAIVVFADSILLCARVLVRRFRASAGPRVWRSPRGLPPRVLYVDCGVHKAGQQVQLIDAWFGQRTTVDTIAFEASAEHFGEAAVRLANIPRLDLRREALVGPKFVGSEVRLYKSGGDGKGDSLFAARGVEYEVAPCVRLSEILRSQFARSGPLPVILRMNIEGAELFVLEDLVETDMTPLISGWYGMWDDLSKIDPVKDTRLIRLLRQHRIRNVTFNDRDLDYPLRAWAIRYDIETSLCYTVRP